MDRLKRLRLSFWLWVHDRAELFWHWVYYKKVQPLEGPPPVKTDSIWYSAKSFSGGDDMQMPFYYYRAETDGSWTRLPGPVDTTPVSHPLFYHIEDEE